MVPLDNPHSRQHRVPDGEAAETSAFGGYVLATLIWLAGVSAFPMLWPSLFHDIILNLLSLLSFLPDHIVLRLLVANSLVFVLPYLLLVMISAWAISKRRIRRRAQRPG
jgi:hypothetical protein